jgi:hypothetical protein
MKAELVSAARAGITLAAAIVCIACCWMFFAAQPAWLFSEATPAQHAGLIIMTGAMGAFIALRLLHKDM